MVPSIPVRVAIIGAGYMASEHLRAFAACPDVELSGIYSRSTEKAYKLARNYPGLQVAESIKELKKGPRHNLWLLLYPCSRKEICREAFGRLDPPH